MKLELIKMPKQSGREEGRSYRRYIITINDVIVDDLKEANLPFMGREGFDQLVGARIKTFEIALDVTHKRRWGTE